MEELYNTGFLCEYKNKEDETQYRKEFLQALNLEEYQEEKIIDTQNSVSAKLCEIPEVKNVFIKASAKASQIMMAPNMESDPDFGLIILVSYDYFDLFHLCMKEYLENNKTITDELNARFNNLVKNIEQ